MHVQVAAFLGVAAVVIVTPGPDTALTIRNTLLGGRRAGIFTALGVSTGQAAWTLATAAGIAALIAASEPAFTAVKLAGAAYLVLLGAQSLARCASLVSAALSPGGARASGLAAAVAFRQGVVSNLGNPKMAAFFPSLLPQFVPAGQTPFVRAARARPRLLRDDARVADGIRVRGCPGGRRPRRPAIRRAVEAVTGAVLVALGLRLATERR